jgi:Alpha/beta hydrolase family
MSRAKNVVLVHGAWADGSSWSKVIPILMAKGLRPTAVQLPLTSLEEDVATLKRAIALEDGPLLLAGHSYGGAVMTESGGDSRLLAWYTLPPLRPTSESPLARFWQAYRLRR